MKIGWLGAGRMGVPMAARLVKAGYAVSIWNRTPAKARTPELVGATVVDDPSELADSDVLFAMLATGKDLSEMCFGPNGLFRDGLSQMPGTLIDCSTIGTEESAEIRARLARLGVDFLAAPVSGNPKCVRAAKLCCVVSGPEAAFEAVKPLLLTIAPRGAAYAGDGELARVCKIAVNLMVAVVSMNMIEVTLLAQKAGVPRHAFLEFLNGSVVGSTFTKYKTPALVNLDFTPTFTSTLQRKDMDLGLTMARQFEVPMPITSVTREMVQAHIGTNRVKPDAEAKLGRDIAAVLETMAQMAGIALESENVPVSDGLDPES